MDQMDSMNELKHYGILGMKWGVRRYQNKDGSYTSAGIRRYKAAKMNYSAAKDELKDTRANAKVGTQTKSEIRQAKRELKSAKQELKTEKDNLRKDVHADRGEELTARGETIGSRFLKTWGEKAAIGIGTHIAGNMLYKYGDEKIDVVRTTKTIRRGATIAGIILDARFVADSVGIIEYNKRQKEGS